MATFKLTNINLQLTKGSFNQNTKRLFKVQTFDGPNQAINIVKFNEPAEVLNSNTLQWHETLLLPAKFNKKYAFEVINQNHYNFGYNPEDIETIYEGHISILKSDEDYLGWQVYMSGKKVGDLFANVQVFSKEGVKKEATYTQNVSNVSFFGKTIDVNRDSIAFTSIYAKFPFFTELEKNRVYLQFEIGGLVKRSAIKRIHQNQYHSYETIQIKHQNLASKLIVTAVSFEGNTNKITKLGSGFSNLILPQNAKAQTTASLNERVKVERVYFYNQASDQIGWASFKYIKTDDEVLDPRFFLQDRFNTIGDINFRPLKNSSMTISQIKNVRPIMSGLETNNRIFMPKAERFDNPAKRKKCQQIGIMHQSLDIKDHPTHHTYKVANFGYGKKIGPVERDYEVPGIGRYQLPTLFDRFK